MAQQPEGQGHVFISYRRRDPDQTFTLQLVDDLRKAGHPVWIDVKGIKGAANWAREIERALNQCYAYVLVLSPDAVESQWVDKEMLYAVNNKRGRVFPVLYRDVALPFMISDLQYIDFRIDYDAPLQKLLAALPAAPRKGPQLPPELEAALRSTLANLRLAAVGELIEMSRSGSPDLQTVALDWLGRLANADGDKQVREAAQSFFDENELRWKHEHGEIEQEEAERLLRVTLTVQEEAFDALAEVRARHRDLLSKPPEAAPSAASQQTVLEKPEKPDRTVSMSAAEIAEARAAALSASQKPKTSRDTLHEDPEVSARMAKIRAQQVAASTQAADWTAAPPPAGQAPAGQAPAPAKPQAVVPAAPAAVPAPNVREKMLAYLLEIGLAMFIGCMGVGWMYAGEFTRGLLILLGGWVLLGITVIGGIATFGLLACIGAPLYLGAIAASTYLLHQYINQNPERFK